MTPAQLQKLDHAIVELLAVTTSVNLPEEDRECIRNWLADIAEVSSEVHDAAPVPVNVGGAS